MTAETAGPVTQGEPILPARFFAGPDDRPDRWELFGTGMTGGEGTTWRARYVGRLESPLPCAVKMLPRPPGAAPDWPDEADLQRWEDQVAVLQHLDPARVVQLRSVSTGPPPHLRGEYAGARSAGAGIATKRRVVYLEMEWLDGPTLDALVRGEPAVATTLPDRLRHIAQAAEAVADLHSRTRTGGNPALHRDLKPSNCIVVAERGVVLIDLSTLRLTDDGLDPLGRHTPGYTAPEVLSAPSRARDTRSDIYSLGALALFCLTGQDPPPASARSSVRLLRQVRSGARAAGIRRSAEFADLLTAAIDTDPDKRPADVRQWSRDLATLAGPAESRSRRRHGPTGRGMPRRTTIPVAVAAAAGVAVATALIVNRPDTAPATRSVDPKPGAMAAPAARPTGGPTAASAPSGTSAPAADGSGAASHPQRPSVASPAPGRSASGTAAAPARPGAPGRATGTPTPTRAKGTIATPAVSARVPQCAYFSGTATLPAGQTLILAMQNLDNHDPTQYVEYVFGWRAPPPSPWSWRGAQFFGNGDDSVGQRYRVRLMAVDIDDAQRVGDEPALAALATPLAAVDLNRVAGAGPNGCVGP